MTAKRFTEVMADMSRKRSALELIADSRRSYQDSFTSRQYSEFCQAYTHKLFTYGLTPEQISLVLCLEEKTIKKYLKGKEKGM